MKCGKLSEHGFFGLFRWPPSSGWLFVLLIGVLLMHGRMLLWSQDSGPKSSNSDGISPDFELNLKTLNNLHNQASNQLTALTQSLNQAFHEVQTSKQQLTSLRNLLDSALQKSTDLENTNQRILEFNQQIGERMQSADEWNAELNEENTKLIRRNVKLIIWAVFATLALVGILALYIKK